MADTDPSRRPSVSGRNGPPLSDALKRAMDLAGATVGLLVMLPLWMAVAVWIKRDSPGPVLFRQGRLGRGGRVFQMCKFRTMVVNAEKVGTGLFSYEDDPRVTRSGWILRATSLDETPQLLNVLAGSMSLVGPRPPVTYELGDYDAMPESMKERFRVKPGITGLAQVSGRNDLSWEEKIVHDREYLRRYRRHGILEDIRILALTLVVVARRSSVVEKRREA